MNYQMHYDKLVARARTRTLGGYVETHHVLPKCLGGSDEKENLVRLTAEEHYVAHQLLFKIYPHVKGLAFALVSMTGNPHGGRSNKAYGWIRRKVAIAQSEESKTRWSDPEFRKKHKKIMDEVRQRPGYGEIFSKIHKGRVKSEQERANIAEAARHRTPRKFSDEARKNMSDAQKKRWAELKSCGKEL